MIWEGEDVPVTNRLMSMAQFIPREYSKQQCLFFAVFSLMFIPIMFQAFLTPFLPSLPLPPIINICNTMKGNREPKQVTKLRNKTWSEREKKEKKIKQKEEEEEKASCEEFTFKGRDAVNICLVWVN